ncbi:MAG TPA: Lsr2 family protein [Nocardia sp.]|uniref:histone-like nucleoid-structuring protein Lsr2 n=1 Tax=Nocardia TaxID=1817 RepID=UPI002453D247|nr:MULTISPECIES: Lsr2 family protein [Nocardia]HLS75541.1 Lsr2 family protein [Nocardia sp.]
MARKVTVLLVDDIDGTSVADETVAFALDGVHYELDLAASNAEQLRKTFAQWTPYARKVGRSAGVKTAPKARREGEQPDQALAIRKWALAEGLQVSSRGRVPAKVVEAYRKANPQG